MTSIDISTKGIAATRVEEWAQFWTEYGELIGHSRKDAREWLDAHPNYQGYVFRDLGQDDEQVDVSHWFWNMEDDE